MMKSIEVMGVKFCSDTVADRMPTVEAFLDDEGMNTITAVTASMLLESQDDLYLRDAFNSVDMLLFGDEQILGAAGLASEDRIAEIENDLFFREVLKRLKSRNLSVFLLAEQKIQLGGLLERLKEEQIPLAGAFAMEDLQGDMEGAVNRMNAATPDVIFSMLTCPLAERFLMEQRFKLNAGLWYGMGSFHPKERLWTRFSNKITDLLHRRKLRKRIHDYDEVERIDEEC